MTTTVLSVVIPAYNEARFIGTLLERIRRVDLSTLDVRPEIVVVDDGSVDDTAEIAAGFPGVDVRRMPRNSGKGAAVRRGLEAAGGDLIIIQDADLEYDPEDYVPMLEALLAGADAVYGSRYMRHPGRGRLVNALTGKHPEQSMAAWVGGQSLSLAAWALTGHYISDTVTALKLFRREVVVPLDLRTTGFELDHEITAKILAAGWTLREVPISYSPRSKAEGKKIGLRDWFRAWRTFFRYRHG